MKDTFQRLYELQLQNPIYSEWAQTTPLKKRVEFIRDEINEALEELEKGNNEAFAEEIGDVFWDTIGAIAKAEHEGILKMKEVLEKIEIKYKERKPHLIEKRFMNKEEELTQWNQVKARQNARKNGN